MRIILREDVPDLGIIGEIVSVRSGYARNYLFPRGLAVAADDRNLKQIEHAKRVIEAKRLKQRGSVDAMAEALAKQTVEIEMRAGRGGKLFGSVSNHDIKKMLDEKGFDIDRRRIDLKTPIKEIGDHEVVIRVGHDVTTKLVVKVVAQGGELVDESVDGDDTPTSTRQTVPTAPPAEADAVTDADADIGPADED